MNRFRSSISRRIFSPLPRMVALTFLLAAAGSATAQTLLVDNGDPGFVSRTNVSVPIFMYHGLTAEHGYNPALFQQQIDYLAAQKCNTITLDHLTSWSETGLPPLPSRPLILTFDDNYLSIYSVAWPALLAHGFVGYNYAHSDYVGIAPGGTPATSYDHADWDEILEMEASGAMLTESHTRTHPQLTTRTPSQKDDEIAGSKAIIEANMPGKTVRHIAYPYGYYDADVIERVQAAGYRTAVTTLAGSNTRSTPLYELLRYTVNPDTAMPLVGQYADAGWGGAAWSSSSSAEASGGSYVSVPAGNGNALACWSFTVPTSGVYRVEVFVPPAAGSAPNASYSIFTSEGLQTAQVDQSAAAGQWVTLGDFPFSSGRASEVSLSNMAGGTVLADALRVSSLAGIADWSLYAAPGHD